MSLAALAVFNGTVVAAVLSALAYVCRIPYRADTSTRPVKPPGRRTEERIEPLPALLS
jgi:hypothetical protein